MHPIQIGFFGTFQGKFAKYPGPPSCKNATTQFHKQNPEKASKTPWNPCTQFRFDFWGLFKVNLLSTLGLPPAKMQQRNSIGKIPKSLQNPRKSMYPIQIWFLGTFQGNFAKYPGPPTAKFPDPKPWVFLLANWLLFPSKLAIFPDFEKLSKSERGPQSKIGLAGPPFL